MTTRAGLLTLAVAASLPIAVSGAELRAGVARVELRPAVAGRDSLQARIVLLRSANECVALVACDLYRFQSKRVSEEARRALDIGTVLFAGSGTRAAPDVEGSGFEDAILRGLKQAAATMFAARVGAGAGTAELAYNWRMVDPQGAVMMLWRNPERKPTGPLWSTIPVWRIEDEPGALRAILYGAASPDDPSRASRRVEAILGERTVALFLPGASGNLAPLANETSEQLAQEVARVSRTITPQPEPNPSLAVLRTTLSFRERWGSNQQPVPVEVATVVVNRNFALAALPGAPFVEHQIALADRSPAGHTLLAAHTQTGHGEWAGVLPTIRAAAEGGYGASYATRLEVGAGEALLDALLVNIYRALGKLDDLPRGDLVRDIPPERRRRP